MWLWCFPRWDMQLVTCQGLDVQKGFREKWSQHSCLQGSAVQHNFDLLRLFEYGYDDACSQFEEFWSENGLFEVQAIYENMGVRGSIPINKCPRWSRCTWHAACMAPWVSEVCGPKPHTPSWNYWRICSRKQKAHWVTHGQSHESCESVILWRAGGHTWTSMASVWSTEKDGLWSEPFAGVHVSSSFFAVVVSCRYGYDPDRYHWGFIDEHSQHGSRVIKDPWLVQSVANWKFW